MMTRGVKFLPDNLRKKFLAAVQTFDTFTRGNDPHGEHDFGSIDLDGTKFFWKIDYYDLAMNQQTADPTDPEATMRVLTLMRADEY
jgi:hypothetical protein